VTERCLAQTTCRLWTHVLGSCHILAMSFHFVSIVSKLGNGHVDDIRDTNGGLFRIDFCYSLQTSPIEKFILVSMELGGNNAYCLTFQRLPRILMEQLEIRNTIPRFRVHNGRGDEDSLVFSFLLMFRMLATLNSPQDR
jgi:hypothetical protein